MKNRFLKGTLALALACSLVIPSAVSVEAADGQTTATEATETTVKNNTNIYVWGYCDDVTSKSMIYVIWDPVDDADSYICYVDEHYKDGKNSDKIFVQETTGTNTFFDMELDSDHEDIWVNVVPVKNGEAGKESVFVREKAEVALEVSNSLLRVEAEKAFSKKFKSLKKKSEVDIAWCGVDLDGDSLPEFMVIGKYNRMELKIYYYDTAAKKIKLAKTTKGENSLGGVTDIRIDEQTGSGFYVKQSDSAYSGMYCTYKLTAKHKLKASAKYTYNYDKNVFKKNGKKIKKATFEKYVDKFEELYSLDTYGFIS